MRDLLFKLLDEIEPNEVLNVRVKGEYGTVFLANKASILPLAIDMRRTQSPSSRIAEQLNMAYSEFAADISSSPQHQYEEEYTDNHKVVFNNVEYIILRNSLNIVPVLYGLYNLQIVHTHKYIGEIIIAPVT